jgi:hypothetical protein
MWSETSSYAIVIDFKPGDQPGTRAEFSYHMASATIMITGKGNISVSKDLEAVLRKIAHWLQASVINSESRPTGPERLARRVVGRQNGNLFPIG